MSVENPQSILTLIAATELTLGDSEFAEGLHLTANERARRKTIAGAAVWRLAQGQFDQAEVILDSEPQYIREIVYSAVKELPLRSPFKTDKSML